MNIQQSSFLRKQLRMKDSISEPARITIENIIVWIESNLSSPLTAKIISEKSGYSLWYFNQCFKIMTGVMPMTYIQFLRMKLAKDLLENTDKTLTQIAMDLGYSQQSIFSRNFKNYYTLTPREFRHNLLMDKLQMIEITKRGVV